MPYFKMLGFIKQHASYDGHRAAEIAAQRVSLRPPTRLSEDPELTPQCRPLATHENVSEAECNAMKEIVGETVSEVMDDRRLLRGRVPQAQDWLD